MKTFLTFLGGICTGILLIMLYLHKGMIIAALNGEKLPDAPECCPAFKPEDDDN